MADIFLPHSTFYNVDFSGNTDNNFAALFAAQRCKNR
jgi:hypothetical protein